MTCTCANGSHLQLTTPYYVSLHMHSLWVRLEVQQMKPIVCVLALRTLLSSNVSRLYDLYLCVYVCMRLICAL